MNHQQLRGLVIAVLVVGGGAISGGGRAQSGSAGAPRTPPAKPAATGVPGAPTPAAAAAASKIRRTPWGDPDLQGVWNDATSTPLERPAAVGETTLHDDKAAAEFEQEEAHELSRDRRDGGAQADVRRAYNENWMDARHLKTTKDRRTSLIVDPPDGRMPPLVSPMSPERQKARALRAEQNGRFLAGAPLDVYDFDVDGRCIIRTDVPPYLPAPYNNDFQIFQSPGYVVIAPEMIHSARIVPLDGRPHLDGDMPQWLGNTRGHFEGATLVLETVNFFHEFDGRVFEGANPKTYRVVERLRRIDAKTIEYTFTVYDPTTWTKPWTAIVPWTRIDPEEQMYEYASHEDNFDMVHYLSGARKAGK
jgi:hypothetical protein